MLKIFNLAMCKKIFFATSVLGLDVRSWAWMYVTNDLPEQACVALDYLKLTTKSLKDF